MYVSKEYSYNITQGVGKVQVKKTPKQATIKMN